ncbi:MAG: transposase family protein [Anaerolineae bacterium]|nr:transposase family protein [Anaerolineae bacterium]MCB9104839.1 transposase family protein [Anaerolineales bacterium]
MNKNPTASIEEYFDEMADPRVEYLVHHQLIDIITIALCAIIAGADTWTEVSQFGKEKQSWFEQ